MGRDYGSAGQAPGPGIAGCSSDGPQEKKTGKLRAVGLTLVANGHLIYGLDYACLPIIDLSRTE